MQIIRIILSLHPKFFLRMSYYTSISVLKPQLKLAQSAGKTIGFVPTMGALHAGHLSLVDQSVKDNGLSVVSIFVNPTQFNNPDDYIKYPRNIEDDIQLLSGYQGKVLVYIPEVSDVYPDGVVTESFDYGGIENEMEGKFRPGHFDGVGTVVKRLFELVEPNNAYFGEKDFQQLQIVKKLVEIENIPVNIIGCPISRAASGLALSSRNKRLDEQQLKASPLIYKVLKQVQKDFGTKSAKSLTQWVENSFNASKELQLEYFTIADEATLKPMQKKSNNKKYRAFIAVFAGDVRLIDNIAL